MIEVAPLVLDFPEGPIPLCFCRLCGRAEIGGTTRAVCWVYRTRETGIWLYSYACDACYNSIPGSRRRGMITVDPDPR